MEELSCGKCGVTQAINQFRRDSHNATGYNSVCHTCNAANQRAWRENNREAYNKSAKEYYAKNAIKIQAQRKARREAKKNGKYKPPVPASQKKASNAYYARTGWKKSKESHWRSRGIKNMTYELYEQMLIAQKEQCLICGQKHTEERKLHVDHNHDTGHVRGLLCNNCNNGMGKLGDSIKILQKAIHYLEKTNIYDNS